MRECEQALLPLVTDNNDRPFLDLEIFLCLYFGAKPDVHCAQVGGEEQRNKCQVYSDEAQQSQVVGVAAPSENHVSF